MYKSYNERTHEMRIKTLTSPLLSGITFLTICHGMDDIKSNQDIDIHLNKLHHIRNNCAEEISDLKIYMNNYTIIQNIRNRLNCMANNLQRHRTNIKELEKELNKNPLNNYFINNFIAKYTKYLPSKEYSYTINISEQSSMNNSELKFSALDNDIYIIINKYFISNNVTKFNPKNIENLQFQFDSDEYSLVDIHERDENNKIRHILEIESLIDTNINKTQELSYILNEIEKRNNNLIKYVEYKIIQININCSELTKKKTLKIIESIDKKSSLELINNEHISKNNLRIKKETVETLSEKILTYKDEMNKILSQKSII